MSKLGDLLFELSNEERMNILANLDHEPSKLSQISQKQQMTVTETSRHLQRLSDAGLITKDSESLYRITPYCKLVLNLVPSLGFASRNRAYFQEHDISVLPPEFVLRFGQLLDYTFNIDTITNLVHHLTILEESEEFCWTAANQYHMGAPPLIGEALKRGIDIRTILPTEVIPPPNFTPAKGIQRRTTPGFNMVLIVSDKEAALGLPYLNGRMDHAQFFSTHPSFLNWCKDLYLHYWNKAKPILSYT